jgi:hypothetical protein
MRLQQWCVDYNSKKVDMNSVREDIRLLVTYSCDLDSHDINDCMCSDAELYIHYCGIVRDFQLYLPNGFNINQKFEPMTEKDNNIISLYMKRYKHECDGSGCCGSYGDIHGVDYIIVPSQVGQNVHFNDVAIYNNDNYYHNDFLSLVKKFSKKLYDNINCDIEQRTDIMLSITYKFKLYCHDGLCSSRFNEHTCSGTVNNITIPIPDCVDIDEEFKPLCDDDLQIIQPFLDEITDVESCGCVVMNPNYIIISDWKIVPINPNITVRFF